MKNVTVLKIGGSIITDKSSSSPKALPDEIKRVAQEIASNHDNLVLVHGAGSFGHPLARKYQLTERFDAAGAVETHRCVKLLNSMVMDALTSVDILAVPIHPFGSFLLEKGRISEALIEPVKLMLQKKLMPVLHGDVVMDAVNGVSILSGDQIVVYIAQQLGADRIMIGSNTDGVLDSNGRTIPVITPAAFIEMRKQIGASSNTDVTGGMLGKVHELLNLAGTYGISSRIFNAARPGKISEILSGAEIGTLIQKDM